MMGSTPLKGDGHSSNTVNYTIPTALGQDPQPVIFKIPKAIRTTREHFHFGMESLSDNVGLGETPHRHNGLKPRAQRLRQATRRAVLELRQQPEQFGLYPIIGGQGIHYTRLITPSQPHWAKTRSR